MRINPVNPNIVPKSHQRPTIATPSPSMGSRFLTMRYSHRRATTKAVPKNIAIPTRTELPTTRAYLPNVFARIWIISGIASVWLTCIRARRAGEFSAVAIPAKHLESRRVSLCANPAPQPRRARAEIVSLSVHCPVPVHVVKLKELYLCSPAAGTLATRLPAAVVREYFQPQRCVVAPRRISSGTHRARPLAGLGICASFPRR
jgi:hypothetical protein